MLATTSTLFIVSLLTFGCVALLSFAVVSTVARREQARQRFGAVAAPRVGVEPAQGEFFGRLIRIDPGRLGLDAGAQRKLRGELIRAGFFSTDGVAVFTAVRFGLLILLPVVGYVFLTTVAANWETIPKVGFAGILLLVAYYIPFAFLRRCQRLLQDKYRVAFPDFLDLLVVCINAGLSLDAALDRVTRELGSNDFELRANLELMAGEMRAGKSTTDAIRDCADRLGLREARSLATLLQQTSELGTDIAVALAVFSDEMRDKRMSRAEEVAASLPPKLTLPLGLFIFPVILIVVLTPAFLKVLKAVGE